MEEELILKMFSNIGVPAAICFYTLYGVRNSLDKLTEAINVLSENHNKDFNNLRDEVKELKYKFNTAIARYSEANRNERN